MRLKFTGRVRRTLKKSLEDSIGLSEQRLEQDGSLTPRGKQRLNSHITEAKHALAWVEQRIQKMDTEQTNDAQDLNPQGTAPVCGTKVP